ncbi:MAG: TetR/AcrR family transcriptional regulator [Eubacteriales bacterium]|nr:TetR/AcrR family transcriptional regulator [Eubacteriales bacterium]
MKKGFDPGAITGEKNPLMRFPQLYEAALDEFSQRSWGEASLNDILRRAGMSKGSLYHHFGDKFGLYLALMDIISQRKSAFFLPRLQGIGEGGDFFRAVKDISREMIAFMFEDARMYHLSARLLQEDPALVKRLRDCFPVEKEGIFLALTNSALRTGQIDERFSPEFVLRMLDILFSNLHLLPKVNDMDGAYSQLELALDMMQHGLCGKDGTNRNIQSPEDLYASRQKENTEI